MFGVLSGAACAMEPEQRLAWTGHVCGVCAALRGRYGVMAGIATNFDAALLSAMYHAQIAQPQLKPLGRCLVRGFSRPAILAADGPGVEYAASMALMMASVKIRDHLQDNQGRMRLARPVVTAFANKWMGAAREASAAVGLDAGLIEDQVRRQAVAEACLGEAFSFYSRPTELAVGAVFGHTAILANRSENLAVLRGMGEMFGRIMVLLDSYRDYAADLKSRSFNALAATFTEGEWEEQAARIFHQAYSALKTHFDQLDLFHPALLRVLLIAELQKTGHRALQVCDGLSTGCHPLGARGKASKPVRRLKRGRRRVESDEENRQEGEQEDQAREHVAADRGTGDGCWYLPQCIICCDPECCDCCDCGDCNCCDCDCGDCDCGDC